MASHHYSVLPPGECCDEILLARDSFRIACQLRADGAEERPLVLAACRLLDVATGQISSYQSVLLQHGRIAAIDPQLPPDDAVVINCAGQVLMPGLCDAHVHVTAVTADLAALYGLPESLVVARSVEVLEGMISRGFTTVRDAGGADWGLAAALAEGRLLGPRLLFCGHALSQTGGHGDFRSRGEDLCACGSALRGIGRVCDGVAEVRRAARDELRKGASFVKVMASGGVASPTDRLTNTQFSREELAAIVEEARAAGTYVAAHAYTPAAIRAALAAGCRSIEHGNWLDAETAALMAELGAFLVPTTVTYEALAAEGVAHGMPPALVAKVGAAVQMGLESMAIARQAGVRMAFGSDLLGGMHKHQSREFLLRAQAGLPAADIIASATRDAAALFGMEGELGELVVGARADLCLVDGDVLADVGLLASSAAISLVIKDGLLVRVPHAGLLHLNTQLVRPRQQQEQQPPLP